MIDVNNKYTIMQRAWYEEESYGMDKFSHNHKEHDSNPDYWTYLIPEGNNSDKIAFDFGCGHGRNIRNLLLKGGFKRVDGCDISTNNIGFAAANIRKECPGRTSWVYSNNGIDLQPARDNFYDYVMSTIVLQHIPVYDIRFSILSEMYRILKPHGILSFQMGFDNGYHPGYTVDYHENFYDAEATNGLKDVCVTDPNQIVEDLTKIGFKSIVTTIRPQWKDGHHNWIFTNAVK